MTWPEPFPARGPEVEAAARMPVGFRAAAMAAGIKPSGKPDLGVLATTDGPASVGAVFTSNTLAAAPTRDLIHRGVLKYMREIGLLE